MTAISHNKGDEKRGKDGIEVMQFKERIRILQMRGFRETLKTIVKFSLFVRTFTFFERFCIHVLPVHWISPIPDTCELRKRFNQWYKESDLIGINMNIEEQLKLLNTLQTHECLMECLKPRVVDPSLLRIIARFCEGAHSKPRSQYFNGGWAMTRRLALDLPNSIKTKEVTS